MDFELSPEIVALRERLRGYLEEEVRPHIERMEAAKEFPLEAIRTLGRMGFMGMTTPKAYGGGDLGNMTLAIALEEINRVWAALGVTVSVHNSLACSPLVKWGTDRLKEKYLPRLATGEWLGAYALTEPEAGSDAANQSTLAVRDGDEWVLDGAKIWITNGAYADLFTVFARTDKSHKTKGISAFLVERTTPGFTVGKEEPKLGIHASSTVEIQLEGCRIPGENLLGEEGKGFNIAMDTLNGGRVGIASQAIGIASACLEAAKARAIEREAFGQSISSFQAIQWKLADMATDLDAGRLLTYRAAQVRDQGESGAQEAAMAKLFASRLANRAANEAVQIFGSAGAVAGTSVERFFRDARITELYEGTTEIQRLVIARNLLRS
ncbi:MAG: acyl-CoA dehydrogenase family protein [Planctomycetota bacterium]